VFAPSVGLPAARAAFAEQGTSAYHRSASHAVWAIPGTGLPRGILSRSRAGWLLTAVLVVHRHLVFREARAAVWLWHDSYHATPPSRCHLRIASHPQRHRSAWRQGQLQRGARGCQARQNFCLPSMT